MIAFSNTTISRAAVIGIFLSSCFLTARSQSTTYEQVYGTPGVSCYGNNISLATNGDFIVGGYYRENAHIMRTNPNGAVVLERAFTLGNLNGWWDEAMSAFEDGNGDLFAAGFTPNGPLGGYEFYLNKITPGGNMMYSMIYGGLTNERCNFSFAHGNDVVMVGQTSAGDGDAVVMRINGGTGAPIWSRRYDILDQDFGWNAFEQGGNYYITGTTQQFGSGSYFLMEINAANGAVNWCRTYDIGMDQWGTALAPIAGGGFALAGRGPTGRLLVMRLNAAGNVMWSRSTEGMLSWEKDWGIDLIQDSNGDLVIATETDVFSSQVNNDAYVLKFDVNGSLLWAQTYTSGDTTWVDGLHGIQQVGDCGYILSGWYSPTIGASNNQSSYDDYVLIRIDMDGHTGCETTVSPNIQNHATTMTNRTVSSVAFGQAMNVTTMTTMYTPGIQRQVLCSDIVRSTLPVDIGNDTVICNNGTLPLTADSFPQATFLWSTGATTRTITVTTPGQYIVTVTSHGCVGRDTINVGYATVTVNLGPDQFTCTPGVLNAANPGASYQWNIGSTSQSVQPTFSGNYIVVVTDTNGCTATDTAVIMLGQPVYTYTTATICQGQSYFVQGAAQSTSGTYYDTLTNAMNCDSIIQTVLTVVPHIHNSSTVHVCQGQSVPIHGVVRTAPGTYVDTFPGSTCDSISTVVLVVNAIQVINQSATICQGQTYFAGGVPQTTSGTYTDSLTSVAGCDSVVTTNLVVVPTVSHTANATICQGQSLFVGGANQTASGTYVDTLTSTTGCDSVVTTNLTVLQVTNTSSQLSTCQGQSVVIHGQVRSVSGVYADTLISANGCDSVSTVTLTVYPTHSTSYDFTVCENDSVQINGTYYQGAQNFSVTYASSTGCDSVVSYIVEEIATPVVSLGPDQELCDGEYVVLEVPVMPAGYTATWWNGSTELTQTVDEPGTYSVIVSHATCPSATDAVEINFKDCNFYIHVPNAFTPNGDAINGGFKAKYHGEIESFEMRIHDRWGEVVFLTNDPDEAWDGNFKGAPAKTDVYVWKINYKTKYEEAKSMIGRVSLLR